MVPVSLRTAGRRDGGPRAPLGARLVVLLTSALTAWVVLVAVVRFGPSVVGADAPAAALTVLAALVTIAAVEPVRRWTWRALAARREPDPWLAVRGLAQELGGGADPEPALRRMVEVVAEGTRAELVEVHVGTGPESVAVIRVGSSAIHRTSELDLPLVASRVVVGHLRVVAAAGGLLPAEERLVRDIAAGAGPVASALLLRHRLADRVDRARSRQAELRRARTDVVVTQTEERRRTAADVHDTCQQRAAVLAGRLGLAAALASGDEPDRVGLAELDVELRNDLQHLSRSLHHVASDEGSPVRVAGGLASALAADTRGLGVPVHVEDDGLPSPPAVEDTAYHVVMEAVQNAVRHGGPDGVWVRLRRTSGTLCLTVADDGSGFDPRTAPRGRGVDGMRARVARAGGRLEVEAGDSGTVVSGVIPVGGPA